jgi:hypothetical protein
MLGNSWAPERLHGLSDLAMDVLSMHGNKPKKQNNILYKTKTWSIDRKVLITKKQREDDETCISKWAC